VSHAVQKTFTLFIRISLRSQPKIRVKVFDFLRAPLTTCQGLTPSLFYCWPAHSCSVRRP